MVTEIDLLRKDIPRLEKKFGADNPFVELLKAQLAFLQDQTEQQREREQHHPAFANFKKSQNRKRNVASNKQL
jgi:hypothetical protein